jgi:hypothetical protein
MKKSLFLFLALVLPVSIFLFLKFFGKNKFDLPVLMKDATEWPKDCPQPVSFPFHASSALLNASKSIILFLDTPSLEAQKRLPLEVDSALVDIRSNDLNSALNGFPDCFRAGQDFHAILFDTTGQIRGLYKKLNREEVDRIIMETKILTGKY